MRALGVAIVVILLVVGLIFGISSICKVPAGYVAVQYDMHGGVRDKTLTQGWHFHAPTVKTTLYTVGIEQSYLTASKQGDSPDDDSFSASTKEGKAIQIDLTYTYQFDANEVTKVFTQFKGQSGKEVRDSFIKPKIISWTKEVIARHPVTDILGAERANINADLAQYLADKFKPFGIIISDASLINIEVDANTMTAINEKITAQQNAERQAIENQTNIDRAKAEAEAKIESANAQAEATRISAEAEADAILLKAEAEAKANEMLNKTLTDEVLDAKKIEAWDGTLPTTIMGDSNSNSVLVQVP